MCVNRDFALTEVFLAAPKNLLQPAPADPTAAPSDGGRPVLVSAEAGRQRRQLSGQRVSRSPQPSPVTGPTGRRHCLSWPDWTRQSYPTRARARTSYPVPSERRTLSRAVIILTFQTAGESAAVQQYHPQHRWVSDRVAVQSMPGPPLSLRA